MFRFKKSVPVEYDRQGYIYFASRLHKELPADEQQRILNLRERGIFQPSHRCRRPAPRSARDPCLTPKKDRRTSKSIPKTPKGRVKSLFFALFMDILE